jgi:hypothetical protein
MLQYDQNIKMETTLGSMLIFKIQIKRIHFKELLRYPDYNLDSFIKLIVDKKREP